MPAKKKHVPVKRDGTIVIRGADVITMNERFDVAKLDVAIEDGRIIGVGPKLSTRGADMVIEAKGLVLMPGFVQAHVHLCQTLFRAQADDMVLLDWLRERIWPMEGALEADDMRAAARLGLSELLLSGTTGILDMGTVRHADVLFEEAARSGIRYVGGKCLMDVGQGYPAGLRETTESAIDESVTLCERWHGAADGRLRYAFSPRFALSCSEHAMKMCAANARAHGAMLHTHASENSEEIELVRERSGKSNIEYLHSLGLTGPDVVLAHGVWLSAEERRILRDTKTRLAHCPSSNLKLASGIARIDELLQMDIHIALGADGAACNNGLDAFMEMRLAAILHKVRGGPTAIPARKALHMATRAGSQALGLEDAGIIAPGMRADVVLLDLHKPHVYPDIGDLTSRVVYSARPTDVHSVIIDGRVVVREGQLLTLDVNKTLRDARAAAKRVATRVA
ncbi:MAG: 5'-deoxyadenosine deaminase [Myxococcota bacterium]|nr:5'-deoxyadenosine deaminase [Myxococcota bacterium]